MKKVIFLDIDGVLNTSRWHNQVESSKLQDEYGYLFDPVAVANLAKIIEETGADIVISSSWKFMGLSKIRKMWKDRNLPGKVVGITPNSVSDEFLLNADLEKMDLMPIRGQEVKEWLMYYGKNIQYVILDDMIDVLHEQKEHFVWINPEIGISEKDVMQAVMILNY